MRRLHDLGVMETSFSGQVLHALPVLEAILSGFGRVQPGAALARIGAARRPAVEP